ncbi:hypothetical protein FRC17_003502 [Serendipita sp. 399]|nr:hypothetical protein FRC17_003502 [Serendipita sp. 399]
MYVHISLYLPLFGLEKREIWLFYASWVASKLATLENTSVPRGPYFRLAFGALALAVADVLNAIPYNAELFFDKALYISTAAAICSWVPLAFGMDTILWIVHRRGQVFGRPQSVPSSSIVSHPWKRILDSILVIATFSVLVGLNTSSLKPTIDYLTYPGAHTFDQYLKYLETFRQLQHVVTALVIVLAINVVVSLIALEITKQCAKYQDRVIDRLLLVIPFVMTIAAVWLDFDIISNINRQYNPDRYLAYLIVRGLCHTVLMGVTVSTMDLHKTADPKGSSYYLKAYDSSLSKAQSTCLRTAASWMSPDSGFGNWIKLGDNLATVIQVTYLFLPKNTNTI